MLQYQPYFKANQYSEINRMITREEYLDLKEFAQNLEMDGWIQDLTPQENLAGVHFKPGLSALLH